MEKLSSISVEEAVSDEVLRTTGSVDKVGTGLKILSLVGTMGLAPKEAK
jgi:hypothetical protein